MQSRICFSIQNTTFNLFLPIEKVNICLQVSRHFYRKQQKPTKVYENPDRNFNQKNRWLLLLNTDERVIPITVIFFFTFGLIWQYLTQTYLYICFSIIWLLQYIFSARTYDPLDPQDESFINDFEKFKTKTFELDRKLGAVLGRAFDDCLVTESIFKLLQIFGNLIQRTLIAHELNDRMPTLVQMLDQEMEDAKIIFQKQKQRIKVIQIELNGISFILKLNNSSDW